MPRYRVKWTGSAKGTADYFGDNIDEVYEQFGESDIMASGQDGPFIEDIKIDDVEEIEPAYKDEP